MGLSFFSPDQPVQNMVALARTHNKPVMIAEATPRGYDLAEMAYGALDCRGQDLVKKTPEEIWAEWYEPFFGFIHANADVIRAVAYINADWNEQPMWNPGSGDLYWGDSRIEANPTIKEQWLNEISSPFWLHGSEQLFATLAEE